MIITLGRQYGSGGHLIAQKLAEKLGIAYYDRTIIGMTAKETGLDEEFISSMENKRSMGFAYSLTFSSPDLPIPDRVFIAESNVIKNVAQQGPCVIVGRCANYVLRDIDNCLRVFIHAPMEQRVKRAIEEYGVPEKEAESLVRRNDKARAAYYNYFTEYKWGQPQYYDISISSALGLDTVTELLESLARRLEQNK